MTAAQAGVRPLWEQVFLFPATGLHDARGGFVPAPWGIDPHPWSSWWLLYVVVGSHLVLVAAAVVAAAQSRGDLTIRQYAWVACSVFALAALAQGLSRTDRSHLLPSTLLAVLALAAVVADRELRGSAFGVFSWVLSVVLVVLVLSTTLVAVRILVRDAVHFPPTRCQLQVERATWALVGA